MCCKEKKIRTDSCEGGRILLAGLVVTTIAALGILVLGAWLVSRSRNASEPASDPPAAIPEETVAQMESSARPPASIPAIDSATLQRYREKPLDTWLLDKICVQPRETHKQSIANAAALLTNSVVSLGRREPVQIPSTPEWNEDPYNDATWRAEYQSLAFVLSLLVAYRESEDTAYLLLSKRYIAEWLDVMLPEKTLAFSWDELSQDDLDACVQLCTARGEAGKLLEIDNRVRKHVNWLHISDRIKKSKRGYIWSDTVAAGRAYVFAVFWQLWCATDLSDRDFEETLLRAVRPHVFRMLDSHFYAWDHNHGFISDTCLLITSIVFSEDKASEMWRQVALSRLSNQIAEGVSSEGVYGEHSPSYHAGMCFRYADIATYIEHYGFKSDIDVGKVIEDMSLLITYCALPNATAPLLGDSSRFAGRATTPGFSEECVYSLTRGRQGSKPSSTSLVLKNAGYAFFRD
ncbi:MAG: heparinase II/III family protein, partial [Kiritimatiellia bacterium]|nr:heparinase II/III family protein [Kiritimatiellia bacterium]